jgi:RNA recognition motif-containing protein
MKVFVGGLPWAVDNDRLMEVFNEFGAVLDARVIYDKETERSRGFGFVTFADAEDAEKLIAHGTIEVDGRTVRIDHANDKKQGFGRRGNNGNSRAGGRGREDHGGGYDDRRGRRKDRKRGRERY